MANAKRNGDAYRYAVVDTALAPGGGGYFTDEVAPRSEHIGRMYFSIRETSPDSTASVAVVKLQYKCPGDADWTNYLKNGTDTWPIGTRVMINDFAAGVVWRAGIADNNDYTSGSVTFGFDW